MYTMIVLLTVVLSGITVSSGLQCYKCEDVGYDSSKSIFSSLLPPSRTNAACATDTFDTFDSGVNPVTCSAGQVCGLVKGSATFNFPVVGTVTAKVNVRDCVEAVMENGCTSDTSDGRLLNDALKFLAGISDVQMNGDSCYCDSNLCVAGGCASGQLQLNTLCIEVWIVGVVVGGISLLIISCIACCCCCCCGCCRNNPPPQTMVIHSATGSAAPPMQFSGYAVGAEGNVGFSNPGYNNGNKEMKMVV